MSAIRITSTLDNVWVGRQIGGNNVDVALLHYDGLDNGCYICVRKRMYVKIAEILDIHEGWQENNCYFYVWIDKSPADVIDLIHEATKETETLIVS